MTFYMQTIIIITNSYDKIIQNKQKNKKKISKHN